MKRIILLLATAFICTISTAQWVPATGSETTYSNVFPNANGPRYNVGTDTRSAFASIPHSAIYANYLNVTVSDYQIPADGRAMFWESSHGTDGSSNLPYDAYDPDVVLVEGSSPISVWAICVYYSENAASPGNPGYYMSCAPFLGSNEFDEFLPPILIDNYTPTGAFPACINIDSDNRGNYAIVFQKISEIESRTATLIGAIPPAPSNPLTIANAKRPDISINVASSLDNVKIVSLSNNRFSYRVHSRQMAAVAGGVYNSPAMDRLNWPRIASPTTLDTRFAITMMERDTATGARNILFNTFNGFTPSGLIAVNNGSTGGYPSDISNWRNVFPAVSYHSSGGNELISLVWHGRRVLGSPNLNNSFIGLDIIPSSLIATIPNAYFDVSTLTTSRNNRATIGVSGRYTDWCKTTAFAYCSSMSNPTTLVWKYVPSPTFSWKSDPNQGGPKMNSVSDKVNSTTKAYPNPTNNTINIDLTENSMGYLFEVFNQNGASVVSKTATADKLSINVSDLSNGIYFIKLLNKDTKEVSGFKFLKE